MIKYEHEYSRPSLCFFFYSISASFPLYFSVQRKIVKLYVIHLTGDIPSSSLRGKADYSHIKASEHYGAYYVYVMLQNPLLFSFYQKKTVILSLGFLRSITKINSRLVRYNIKRLYEYLLGKKENFSNFQQYRIHSEIRKMHLAHTNISRTCHCRYIFLLYHTT